MKNVFLIQGFHGVPKIFKYIKNKLEERKFKVIIPSFPIENEITVESYFNVLDMYKKYFNEDTIVIAHSIGNPLFIKYLSKRKIKIDTYISLAGFSKPFYNEGKDVLNEKVKLSVLTNEELDDCIHLVKKRYSVFSKTDHLVPYNLLKEFSNEIKSKAFSIDEIGHMGRKSGLEELPIVIDLVLNQIDYRYVISEEGRAFHEQRRAFIILNNKLEFLPAESNISHFEYCKAKGLNKEEFNRITRGYYFNKDLVFYKDNFIYDDLVIKEALQYVNEIAEKLNINEFNICFGLLTEENFKLAYNYGKHVNGKIIINK